MDAATLYAMAVCAGFSPESPPCSLSIYRDELPARSYQWPREGCLSAARRMEAKDAKHKVFCVGSDGVSLASSGEVVDPEAYYEALAGWHGAQKRNWLPSK